MQNTYVTADKLNADYSIVAWGGICTKVNHWSSISMANLYKRVSYMNTAEYAFDFSPDVVVVNLGTNESSYLSGHLDYAQQFPSDYKDFLTYIREKNPDAYIICLYGMMGKNATISKGIETACKQMNDEKVLYNPFNIIANTSAANGHPSATAQEAWGELLSQYIFSILGTSDLAKLYNKDKKGALFLRKKSKKQYRMKKFCYNECAQKYNVFTRYLRGRPFRRTMFS